MEQNKPARGQLDREVDFFDREYGKQLDPGWFEKWLFSLYPHTDRVGKLFQVLGDVNGKHICEIGCGTGELTEKLAGSGAHVSAIDISEEAVRQAREKNERFIPQQVDIQQMDAGQLAYDSNSFDVVLGIDALHHLDTEKVIKEFCRILKPKGRAIFIEPLGNNFIISVWRRLTPSCRTPDESPFSYSEILKMGEQFESVQHQEFELLTLLSSFAYLFTHSQRAKRKSAEFLYKLEAPFLKLFKPLKRYCGMVVIIFIKGS